VGAVAVGAGASPPHAVNNETPATVKPIASKRKEAEVRIKSPCLTAKK
jgi:hypothetical protein